MERSEGVVRMDAEMWALVAEVLAVNARVAGMTADNMCCVAAGNVPEHDSTDFERETTVLEFLAERLRTEV